MNLHVRPRGLKWLLGIGGAMIFGLFFIAHVILPPILLRELNEHLGTFSKVYSLHITSLELSFLRMSYRFNEAEAKFKKDGHTFMKVESVEVAIAWRELFRGRILTNVTADGGEFVLTKKLLEGSRAPEAKPKEDASHVAEKLFPVRIARIELHRSSFQFANLLGESEDVRWRVTGIEGRVLNLTPTPHTPFTFFTLQGSMLESAMFKLAGQARRLDEPLAWKADLEIKGFDLVAANPMLMRLVPLNFGSGHLDLYSEVLSQHGQLQGYVKPFFKKLHVLDNKEHFVSVKHFAVEVVATFANWILRKHEDKTVAARIPFHKEGDSLKVDSAEALETAIQHGFSEPLKPGLEDSLQLKEDTRSPGQQPPR